MQQQASAAPIRAVATGGLLQIDTDAPRLRSAKILDFSLAKNISATLASTSEASVRSAVELSLPTERQLIERWKTARDSDALLRLIMTMQRFLKKVARKHGAARGVEQDLIHEGVLAIIVALERYEPVEDSRLLSFVWRRVVSAMSVGRQRVERIVDRPQERPRRPHDGRLAPGPPGTGSHSSIEDVDEAVLSTSSSDPEQILLASEKSGELVSLITRAIEGLSSFERELIVCRLEEGSLEEVAGRHGATAELARKTEARALQKMRMSLMMSGYAGMNREKT